MAALTAYLSVTIFLFSVSILLELMLIYASRQGSIVQVEKRSSVVLLLCAHLLVSVCEMACCIFGCVVLWNRATVSCASDVVYEREKTIALLTIVVVSQLVNALGLTCCLLACRNPGSKRALLSVRTGQVLTDEWANSKWFKRQRRVFQWSYCCLCTLAGGSRLVRSDAQNELMQVAENLTRFFHHSGFLDVTPSDVIAGLLLVRLQQRHDARALFALECAEFSQTDDSSNSTNSISGTLSSTAVTACIPDLVVDVESPLSSVSPVSPQTVNSNRSNYMSPSELLGKSVVDRMQHMQLAPRRTMDPSNPEDKRELELILYCAYYVWGVYGHFMYLYTYPVTGWCGLCCAAFTECSASSSNSIGAEVNGDKCCGANKTGMQYMLRTLRSKLIHASFENDVNVVPYAVHHDQEKNYVVISVRGTFSLEDFATDGKFHTENLDQLGTEFSFQGENRYGHKGFVDAAAAICREIFAKKLLDSFYAQGLGQTGGTKLLIVGHSLGAAVACLISLFLSSKYPGNVCIGYGMPGAVCDETTALELSQRVTSVVNGKDLIARLNPHSLSTLRKEVLDCIARCKVGKFDVISSFLNWRDSSPRSLEQCYESVLYPRGCAPESEFKATMDSFIRETDQSIDSQAPLYLPGAKVVHFIKDTDDKKATQSFQTRKYLAVSTTREAFLDILVSPTMLIDHMPDRYLRSSSMNL